MTKRMVMGEYNGKQQVFIQIEGGDEALVDVHANIDKFAFHSDFIGLVDGGTAEASFNIPAVSPVLIGGNSGTKNGSSSTWTSHVPTENTWTFLIPGLVAGTGKHCLVYHTGSGILLGGDVVIAAESGSFLSATIEYVGNTVYLRAKVTTGPSGMSAKTIPIKAYVLDATSSITDPGVLASVTPELTILAEGRFRSDAASIVVNPTSGVELKLPLKPVLKSGLTGNNNFGVFNRIKIGYNFDGVTYQVNNGALPPAQTPVVLGVV